MLASPSLTARPPCRLAFFLAEDRPIATILRKGPTGWVCLLRWNTKTDEITAGQWLHARVYEDDSDLSPDGEFLVYYARDGRPHRDFETWTAVSRPPNFTAVALWSQNMPGGGGTFLNRRTLVGGLGEPLRGAMGGGWKLLGWGSLLDSEKRRLKERNQRNRGWRYTAQWRGVCINIRVQEAIADRKRHAEQLHEWLKRDPEESLSNELAPKVTTMLPQCIFDQRDRLIYSRRGKLWRIERMRGELQVREIADLNPLAPECAKP